MHARHPIELQVQPNPSHFRNLKLESCKHRTQQDDPSAATSSESANLTRGVVLLGIRRRGGCGGGSGGACVLGVELAKSYFSFNE